MPEADLQIRMDGSVDYPSNRDLFLGGRGTGSFVLVGLPIGIDSTALVGTAVVLVPLGIAIDPSLTGIQTVWLLPQQDLGLVVQSTPALTALFDLKTNGSVEFFEPAPFVTVDRLDGHPLFRLTLEVVRTRSPCRRPHPIPSN